MAKGNPKRRTDADGVVWIDEPGLPWLRTALGIALVALVAVGGAWILRPRHVEPDHQGAEPRQPQAAAPAGQPPSFPARAQKADPMERAIEQALEQHPLPPADEPSQEPAPRRPPPGEPQEITVDQLPRGDGTGIDAFPRPGTKPLRGGLIVPDDYQLPPGYMRHYQTTDDGEQLPAILLYQPNFTPRGADGQPLPVPPDRIVPRELAPPGLPGTWLVPPPVRRERR